MNISSGDNVEIKFKELIKPSSPTPNHLKNLKLSLLDQLPAPVYIPLLFFYEADELKGLTRSTDHVQICHLLKQSLSNILTTYYPLAGIIDPENFMVDCNDNGVEFIEARAYDKLKDVLEEPKIESFRKYLPVDPLGGIYRGEGTLFMAQVNFLDCGGIVIGACVSHIMADAEVLVRFMNAWAATCRGENTEPPPNFSAMARNFPARDLSDLNISPPLHLCDDKLVLKRYIFDREILSVLKQEASGFGFPNVRSGLPDDYYVKDPTRVEVVSAFIWRHFIQNKLLDAKKCIAVHVVNIRSRASPSLQLEHTFGNGCFLAPARTPQCEEHVPQLHELVRESRRAIRTIDDNYIRESRDEDRYLKDLGELFDAVSKMEQEGFLFSSWSRFPIYEVDFGWGGPVWVGTSGLQFNNFAIFMNTKSGDGIEVWIYLLPEDVHAFENQLKLITTTKN